MDIRIVVFERPAVGIFQRVFKASHRAGIVDHGDRFGERGFGGRIYNHVIRVVAVQSFNHVRTVNGVCEIQSISRVGAHQSRARTILVYARLQFGRFLRIRQRHRKPGIADRYGRGGVPDRLVNTRPAGFGYQIAGFGMHNIDFRYRIIRCREVGIHGSGKSERECGVARKTFYSQKFAYYGRRFRRAYKGYGHIPAFYRHARIAEYLVQNFYHGVVIDLPAGHRRAVVDDRRAAKPVPDAEDVIIHVCVVEIARVHPDPSVIDSADVDRQIDIDFSFLVPDRTSYGKHFRSSQNVFRVVARRIAYE